MRVRWQTGPICTQLEAPDRRSVDVVNSSRLPATFESVAPMQCGSMYAATDQTIASSEGRGSKISGKRSRSAYRQEQSPLSQPPFCRAKKRRWMATNNRSETFESVPHPTPLQGLYMVPNVVQKNYFMAKIDLKDAYLTVPVAAEFRCIMAFPNENQDFLRVSTWSRECNSRLGVPPSQQQQQLSPAVFDALNQLLGPISIDLFASRINHQLPIYCSWKSDPGAMSIDAFSITQQNKFPYMFPPFCLIDRALLVQRDLVNEVCLIAPAWPGQVWYSQLLIM